jgi:hypothetical protein
LVLLLLSVLLAMNSLAGSNVTFRNDSGKTLYVYHGSARNGATLECANLTYGGSLAAGARWSYSVGADSWGWVRFLEEAHNADCSRDAIKFETRIAGSSERKAETISVR